MSIVSVSNIKPLSVKLPSQYLNLSMQKKIRRTDAVALEGLGTCNVNVPCPSKLNTVLMVTVTLTFWCGQTLKPELFPLVAAKGL